MQSFKKGNLVRCISLEGFACDSQNFLINVGIKLNEEYIVYSYTPSYLDTGVPGISIVDRNCVHPASSFKLVTDEIINSYEIY